MYLYVHGVAQERQYLQQRSILWPYWEYHTRKLPLIEFRLYVPSACIVHHKDIAIFPLLGPFLGIHLGLFCSYHIPRSISSGLFRVLTILTPIGFLQRMSPCVRDVPVAPCLGPSGLALQHPRPRYRWRPVQQYQQIGV